MASERMKLSTSSTSRESCSTSSLISCYALLVFLVHTAVQHGEPELDPGQRRIQLMGDVPDEAALPVDLLFDLFRHDASGLG